MNCKLGNIRVLLRIKRVLKENYKKIIGFLFMKNKGIVRCKRERINVVAKVPLMK